MTAWGKEKMIETQKNGIESAFVEGPFDTAKAELEGKGYDIVSLEQFAKLRIAQGAFTPEGKYTLEAIRGTFTREGFLYVPKKGKFLVRNSPIMTNAKEATERSRSAEEFYLTQEQVDEALKDSVQFKNSKAVPTNRFADDERTAYAFGKTAEAYGNFLRESGISQMPIWLEYIEKKPCAKQAWVHGLAGGRHSGLSRGRLLFYKGPVCGVRKY